MTLQVFVDGIGIVGPGLADWPQAREVLAGRAAAVDERARLPAPALLPPAERRRAGQAVKAALACAHEALAQAGIPAQGLASVFTSSGGDGVNCHLICEQLATSDRLISPTRFHNSVHNAPSGYWSIATGAMATSSVLCAHDGSFAAGLLEALTQCARQQVPVLLVAYDTDYPEPLRGVRPIPDTLGLALLLAPMRGERSVATLSLDPARAMQAAEPATLADAVLEALRTRIPAARGLPLLAAIAHGQAGEVVTDYLPGAPLTVHCAPGAAQASQHG